MGQEGGEAKKERESKCSLLVGQFSLLEAARWAKIVWWNTDVGEPVRDQLVQFLVEDSRPKVSKRKWVADKFFPTMGGEGGWLCCAPLVAT